MELLLTRRRAGAIVLSLSMLAAHGAQAAVGRTPGTGSVTANGEAAYSMPLALPPGTNGMTPSLSLEYRHRVQGGLLGVGWSIDGLSQIVRCRRTPAQDGPVDPALRFMRDRFCLDGQRLVVVNGLDHGAAGAEYRTEIESFARIRQVSGSSPAPQSFLVETRDGRVLEYGATASSRIDWSASAASPYPAVAWALNRIRDRSGNVIDFEYTEDTATPAYRIANIRYNSNPGAGVAASHRVAFVYETRPNSEVDLSYVAGTPTRLVVRLDRIDVFHNSTLLRRYELSYEPALASGRSRLASVRECGRGGTDCLAPTVFTWQNGTPGLGAAASAGAAIPAAAMLPGHQLLNSADINGDGRDDLVYAAGASMSAATIRYRLGTAGGPGAEVDTGIACPSGIGTPFDYNGDGRSDLVMAGGGQWRIVPGTASGFGPVVATGLALPQAMVDYRGADVDGDGLGDIVWSEAPFGGDAYLNVRVRLARAGGGFEAEPRNLYSQTTEQGFEYARGGTFFGIPGARVDLDLDGGDDLLLNEYETMTRITIGGHSTEGVDGSLMGGTALDMNGDGCTDFAYAHYSGWLRIRVGECGVAWTRPELQGPAWKGSRELRAHDWNGDGRDDILLMGQSNWMVAVSNGDSFAAVADTGIAHEGAIASLALDFNGDGLADLAARIGGQIRLRPRNGPKPDLLLSAADGFGVAAGFTYRPLTDAAVYTRGPDASYPDQAMQTPAYVVAELMQTDGSGSGAPARRSFTYEGLRRNLQGRGNLGFSTRTATDDDSGGLMSVTETLHQAFPYTGLPVAVITRQPGGKAVGETAYSWATLPLGSGPAARQFPYAATTTVRRREAGGIHDGVEIASLVRAVSAIDPVSGAVTDETATVTEVASGAQAGASATLRTVHTGLLNDTANWCIGRPTATQLTASHTRPGGEAITRSASQEWDGQKCRLTQLRREPGSGQSQVTIGLAYDAFGNVASRSIAGAGMSARTTAIHWGPRGQLPASVTNPLQQGFTLAWDPASGLPLSVTDPNSLRVTWSYDAHGRLVQQSEPQGTSTLWSRAPCAGGCDARTRFQLTQRERDSTGAVRVTTVLDMDQHDRGFRIAAATPGGGTAVQLFEADARGRERRRHAPFWAGGSPAGYWQLSYDAQDRLTGMSLHAADGALLRAHTLRHDGLAVTHVDALGRRTTGVRTAWGTPAEVTDPAGGVTRYEYDAFGNLLSVRDPLGILVASATYNAAGMLLTQTEMNSGTWTYTRNALGEIVALRDARSQDFAFAYDLLGRLTSRTAPEGASSFSWGTSASARNIGRLAGLAGPGYAEGYGYDSAGRLASRTITSDARYRYDYAYDAFGLPATLTYPAAGAGARFRLAFDHDAGQLVRVRDGATSAVYWALGTRDAAGNVLDETLGTALRVVSGYDPVTGFIDYRRTTAGAATVQDVAYNWDAGDNLKSRRDLRQGLTEKFRYDLLDRLVDSRLNGAINLDLDYDAAGNIRWKSDVCPTSAPCYAYDANRRHAVTSVAGQSYAYDANGNMTNRGGAAIAWTSTNLPGSIAGTGGNSSRFWYGPAGNRWKQAATYAGAAETTIYVGGLMEKVTRAGTTTWRHYVPTPNGVAAVHLRDAGGAPMGTRYLARDHLGSVDRILDEAGDIVVPESFAPFGRRRGASWSGVPGAGELAALAAVTRRGFAGHEHLDNLGLIHMGGRVYDPQLSRFLGADPHVTAPFTSQSLNRYSYVWNNPLSLVDPSGFDPAPPCMQAQSGACAQVTVIGAEWADWMRALLGGGAGAAQHASAAQRDPCGQDGSALACAMQNGGLLPPSSIVLTAGTQTDPMLGRSPTLDRLQGLTASLGNIAISSSPVSWLFGADPGFEWFDVPDSAAGRAGATLGNVGYLLGGAAGIVRMGGGHVARGSTSLLARAAQTRSRKYVADRFRDITLREGKILYAGYPGSSGFFTTASALSRANRSAAALFGGLQVATHPEKGMRTMVAAYEVIDDTAAAFGIALANGGFGKGWLPQVFIPGFEDSLRFLGVFPLKP
jgi:RHS repeat-associated protein